MQRSGILKILFLLVITAAVSAGCIGPGYPAFAEITQQMTHTPTEATATSPPQTDEGLKMGDRVSSTDIFSGNYSWCEYRENLTSDTPSTGMYQSLTLNRIERTIDDYNGESAIHYKSISKREDSNLVSDFYYDISMSNFLGGSIVKIRNGQIDSIENFTAEPLNEKNRPFGEKIQTFIYQGTESVTTPSGTYPEARKYILYNSDNTVGCTYWFAPEIPVPVLYQYSPKYFDGKNAFMSVELLGWG